MSLLKQVSNQNQKKLLLGKGQFCIGGKGERTNRFKYCMMLKILAIIITKHWTQLTMKLQKTFIQDFLLW